MVVRHDEADCGGFAGAAAILQLGQAVTKITLKGAPLLGGHLRGEGKDGGIFRLQIADDALRKVVVERHTRIELSHQSPPVPITVVSFEISNPVFLIVAAPEREFVPFRPISCENHESRPEQAARRMTSPSPQVRSVRRSPRPATRPAHISAPAGAFPTLPECRERDSQPGESRPSYRRY